MSNLYLFWGENKKDFSKDPHFTLKKSLHGFAIAVGIHYLDTNSSQNISNSCCDTPNLMQQLLEIPDSFSK
jgi:hypothetical protein